MVPVLRDCGLSALLEPDAELERLAGGFEFTEGPLWLRDGSLLFQDIKAERTYRLDPGDPQPHVVRQHTARPTARRSSRTATSSSASRTAAASRA